MTWSTGDLDMIAAICQKRGITRLKMVDLEFDIKPSVGDVVDALPKSMPIGEAVGMPTDDQMLFHSAPEPMTDEEIAAQAPK